MMDAHFYTVNVEWLADKKGILTSPELAQNVEVATPPPFQGGIEQIWSPEHLFTSAVVSCFMTTFLAIAANSKLTYSDFKCNAKGKLEQIEGKYLMTEVLLEAHLTIDNIENKEKAERVLEKSERACLISNSIKSIVTLTPIINIA
jgi:organic hydroperoxide reductase OsmC/OhrA